MERVVEADGPADEPADAAAAFEALRREVALLNAAVTVLAAERPSAPDYSATLGEIAKGVAVAVGRLGELLASPAFGISPADLARQIVAAGDEARRHERSALEHAQANLARAAGDLRGWIDGARLAQVQNHRLVQAMLAGLLAGSVLGALGPGPVARAAPESWAWPEKMAARVLGRDLWSAGERMLEVGDARKWQESRASAALVAQNRDALAKCAQASKSGKHRLRCLIRIP